MTKDTRPPEDRLREAAEAVVRESSFKEDGTPGAYPSIAAITDLRAALASNPSSLDAAPIDVEHTDRRITHRHEGWHEHPRADFTLDHVTDHDHRRAAPIDQLHTETKHLREQEAR